MYPRTITSLRHVWTHPSVPESLETEAAQEIDRLIESKQASQAWLEDYAKKCGFPVDNLMAAAHEAHQYGEEYVIIRDFEAGEAINPEFFKHFAIVTGKKFETQPEYFSCNC